MNVKPIPGTQGFSASDIGVIYGPDGKVRNNYENLDGYATASVKLTSGKWQTFGVHRLVCMAHLEPPGNPASLTVNHRDKNVKNNNLTNLEWVSVAKNNVHASLVRGSSDRPILLAENESAGLVQPLYSLAEAAEWLQADSDLVWDHVRDGIPMKGWKLIHISSRDNVHEALKKLDFFQKGRVGKIPARPLSVLDVEENSIQHFDSLMEVAKHFKVDPSHIPQIVSSYHKVKLFKRKYVVVDKGNPFPNIDEDELRRLRGPTGYNVLAYSFSEDKYALFESASSFVQMSRLSKKAVTTRLKKGKIEQVGDWIFTYLSSDAKERLRRVVQTRLDSR